MSALHFEIIPGILMMYLSTPNFHSADLCTNEVLISAVPSAHKESTKTSDVISGGSFVEVGYIFGH